MQNGTLSSFSKQKFALSFIVSAVTLVEIKKVYSFCFWLRVKKISKSPVKPKFVLFFVFKDQGTWDITDI